MVQQVASSVESQLSKIEGALCSVVFFSNTNESLKHYLNRYDQESNLIDNLSPEVMKIQLISGLHVSEFYQYIKRKNIVDLAHFKRKAEEWIAMEEACAAKKDDLNTAAQPPK